MSRSGALQDLLELLGAHFGEGRRALLLVDLVVVLGQLRNERIDGVVELGAIVERAGDDQRRARLVDQDRVDLVDDRVVVAALDHRGELVLHVVAQVVEAELVVGAVGDVAGVGRLALGIVHAVDDDADGHAQELVDLPHPFGVALGEVVVDGDDVDALAGERVQVNGEGGDQGLAFAGLHLGDGAFMEDHAADQLDVEVALAEGALAGLADGRERRHEQVVDRLAGGELGAELVGAGAQVGVRQRGDLGLQRVDLDDGRGVSLQAAVVGGSENLSGKGAETGHQYYPLKRSRMPVMGCGTGAPSEKTSPERCDESADRTQSRTAFWTPSSETDKRGSNRCQRRVRHGFPPV